MGHTEALGQDGQHIQHLGQRRSQHPHKYPVKQAYSQLYQRPGGNPPIPEIRHGAQQGATDHCSFIPMHFIVGGCQLGQPWHHVEYNEKSNYPAAHGNASGNPQQQMQPQRQLCGHDLFPLSGRLEDSSPLFFILLYSSLTT
ncbi:hypothetical protein D3C87_1763730 [compost metagenome]